MSLHFPNSWLEILVVATDPERLRLTRDALRTERGKLHVARDGPDVRALLTGEGALDVPIRPNVVLLDLSLSDGAWPAITSAIVEARLTGPVIAIEWLEEVSAAVDEKPPEEQVTPHGDLSRLIRRAILQKRTQDERSARLQNEGLGLNAGAVEGGQILGSGGADGPGSHAGIGNRWLHLTLREGTQAGMLDGLARLRSLADKLPRTRAGSLRSAPAMVVGVWPNELIRQVAERYRPIAEVRGVRLLEMEEEYATRITADEAALLAALGVLTAYVLHFARPGHEIMISTGVGNGDAVDFGVSFRGAGIAEDHLPLLSDAFAGASPIVEAHGASLVFGSSWGKSFGFGFGLPESLSNPAALYEQNDSE